MLQGIILSLSLLVAIIAISFQLALNIQQCKEEKPHNVRLIIEVKDGYKGEKPHDSN